MSTSLQPWQQVWRSVFGPSLSDRALEELRKGLARDDETILQGNTCLPAPLHAQMNDTVEACCALAYGIWAGDYRRAATVDEIEQQFCELVFSADLRLGEARAARHFLTWWDEGERTHVVDALLKEVILEQAQRQWHPRPAA